MPAYGPQIPLADRWAIVAYLRALQRQRNATLDDVPEDVRPALELEIQDSEVAPADPAEATNSGAN
jgi:hypothetical protein